MKANDSESYMSSSTSDIRIAIVSSNRGGYLRALLEDPVVGQDRACPSRRRGASPAVHRGRVRRSHHGELRGQADRDALRRSSHHAWGAGRSTDHVRRVVLDSARRWGRVPGCGAPSRGLWFLDRVLLRHPDEGGAVHGGQRRFAGDRYWVARPEIWLAGSCASGCSLRRAISWERSPWAGPSTP